LSSWTFNAFQEKSLVTPLPAETEAVAKTVLDGAFAVHRALGPGLMEGVYETCLCHEMHKRNLPFERQLVLPILYDGVRLDAGLRLDVLADQRVIVELKAVEKMIPLYEAQLLTYLKLTGHRLGLLINFNVPVLKEGIRRVIL
jgi:GxxExxY protein